MICPICNQELPTDAVFCHKCTNQIACKDCGKPLSTGGLICNYCGKPINKPRGSANRFEFKEDMNSRSFTADFSDSTAGNVVETLAQLLTSNKYKFNAASSLPENTVTHEDADVVFASNISDTKSAESDKGDLELLDEIFQSRGDELYLHETELKGSSLLNHTQRVALLFLYRKYLQGHKSVNRSELTEFLNSYSYNTGSYRGWIKSTNLINKNNGQLSLCRSGIDEATKYLYEVFDPNVKSTWKPDTAKKKSSNGTSGTKETKSKTQNRTYKILGNLDFKPKGKESLNDFIAKYSPKSGFEYNVLFVYYLEKIIGEQGITPDHVYSCYKAIQHKFPSNLYQSIVDTSNRKGWLNTTNVNDIKITTSGENAVEHDLMKK